MHRSLLSALCCAIFAIATASAPTIPYHLPGRKTPAGYSTTSSTSSGGYSTQPALSLRVPGADFVAAAGDIVRVPHDQQPYCRYLSLHNLPDRQAFWRLLCVHCNTLSPYPDITKPVVIPGTDGSLLRVNCNDYGWKTTTWDKLGEFDPYFHASVEKEVIEDEDWGHYEGGVFVKDEVRKTKTRKKVTAIAPWVAEGSAAFAAKQLVELTQSTAPVLRGDWFFRQTVTQEPDKYNGKAPGYYDFLRLGKSTDDFTKLIGADINLARKQFQDERSGIVIRSDVTHNNRRLTRLGKIGGGYWLTLDARQNVGRRNFPRTLDDEAIFDATEQFGTLPNGLFAWWLANNKEERQDFAPDFIASESTAPGTDRRVRINVSCLRCHVDGVKPISDWARRSLKAPFGLQSPEYAKLQSLRRIYFGDIDHKMVLDVSEYQRAVATASDGWTAREYSEAVSAAWIRYQETAFDLERVSLETGVPSGSIKTYLSRSLNTTGTIDPILMGLLQSPVEPIRSEHWEEVFPIIMSQLRGFNP